MREALTRKFGPLPAWAWALIAGIVLYWYRNRTSGGGISSILSGGSTTTTGGSITPNQPTPQAQQTLDPGQSLYDPNTGAFLTAPGGSSTSGTDPYASMSQAIMDAIAAGTFGGQGAVDTTPSGAPAPTPMGRRLPPVHIKPPKRRPKPKHLPKTKIKAGSKRGRSHAVVKHPRKRHTLGARMTFPKPKRVRVPAGGKNVRHRNRPKATFTRNVLRQRPIASAQPARSEPPQPAPVRQVPHRAPPRPTPARHASAPVRHPARPVPHRHVTRKR